MTDMAAVAQKYDHLFKMLLIGNTGVGKTCLLERCSEGRFRQDVRATIGMSNSEIPLVNATSFLHVQYYISLQP